MVGCCLSRRKSQASGCNMESHSPLPKTSHTSQISYESLDTRASSPEIRLVTIEQSDDTSAVVRCSIDKTRLNPDCRYAALSYVWSDPPGTGLICVNGAQVEVTKNLELALQHVRNGTSERVLWVDALSINQADFAERSSQVMIMDQIFKQAEKVICWVGLAVDGSDRTLVALDTSELEGWRERTMNEGVENEQRFLERTLGASGRAALEHFTNSTYWTRTWILQEIALAKEIVILYGLALLPWHLLETLHQLSALVVMNPALSMGSLAEHPSHKTIEKFRIAVEAFVYARHHRHDQSTNDILTLARNNSHLHATDMRDKIYGFCGLATDAARFVLVDYTKSVADVYESFARMYIEKSHSLHIISYAVPGEPGNQQPFSLPSWVPDWSRKRYSSVFLEQSLYAAAKDMTHSTQLPGLDNGLHVRGANCDSISMFKPELGFWGLEDLLFSRGPFDHPSGVPRLQALFRTLTADRYRFSGKRFGHDADRWFYHNSMGFLVDLGIQTNFNSEYAQSAMNGSPETTAGGAAPGYEDVTAADVDWRQHDFVLAFRDWAESCIELLDDMIRRRRVPKPQSDGALRAMPLVRRAEDRYSSGEHTIEHAVFDVARLSSWKEALEKTRSCSSMESMLELFLGAPGGPRTTPWLGNDVQVRNEHGAACWSIYYRNMAPLVGENSTFITGSGYIGIGPKVIRANDEIHVLLGCRVPVVLRRTGDEYMFLGPCFVHGLMDGEAIESVNAGQLVLRDLRLV